MKKEVNQLKAGVVLSYVQIVLSNGISILYTPIMLRLLGKSEYGLYNLVSSVVGYLGLLSFGFGSAYMRYYSRAKAQKDEREIARINGMFMTIYLVIGGIALIAGLVLTANTEMIFGTGLTVDELEKTKILTFLMVIGLAVSFPMSVFSSNVTANEQYIFQRLLNMVNTVLSPMVMLPVLLMGYKSVAMVMVSTIITFASYAVRIWYCVKKLHIRFEFRGFEFTVMREMAAFSGFIFLNQIVDQINWSVDKYVLGRIVGTAGVAVYSVGSSINMYYLGFSTSISSVFIPKINRMVAFKDDDAELTDLFTRVGRIQFIVLSLILTGFIFFGKYFIVGFFAGAGYENAYVVALLLIIPVTIPLIQTMGIEIQRAKNMHHFRSIVYALIAVGNLAISIPLCKKYGEIGSAAGTTIALVCGNIIAMNWYNHKKVGLNMVSFWKSISRMLPGLVIPCAFGIVCSKVILVDAMEKFIGLGSLYVIIFGFSMWKLGMNNYERQLFGGFVRKVFRKKGI